MLRRRLLAPVLVLFTTQARGRCELCQAPPNGNTGNWRAMCAERSKHGSEGGCWKSTSNGNSLAPYPRLLTLEKREAFLPHRICKVLLGPQGLLSACEHD